MASKHKPVQHINTAEIFRLKPLSACVRMAIAGGVFFGSVSPGYAELPVPAQTWVTMGAASSQIMDNGNTLQINQQTEQAILNWNSFNVGADNQVNFKQPDSSAIALNRIFQQDPSQILGRITANGQIYLYNQNGFVFDKNSSVDANTVVASTLNISDAVFKNGGIVNQFNNNGGAALNGKPGESESNPCVGSICINEGAKIHVGENGRLIMAGRSVTNAGNLEADKFGQIILVASKDKVYLQPASSDGPFAGLLVEVGSGGNVTNTGAISVRQGNITLAGFAVNQQGLVSATTSVNVNGSIRLLAREGQGLDGDKLVGTDTLRKKDLNDGLGTESKVTFAPGSITQIVADADGGAAIDEQTQPSSYLEVSAHTVQLQSGSAIGVPGGKVDIVATDNLLDPTQGHNGRIILEGGASIDVSGSKNISVSVQRNVVDVPVQSFELRDSPLQKGGVLQGQTIRVDIRKDNNIVDISGALARIQRSIDERLGKGGTVNLTSSGDVIVNNNATINISGGTVNYKEGYINTTKLLTDYGKIIDIGDADPNQHYQAIYGSYSEVHEKWGVTKIWQADGLIGKGTFEKAYQQGLDAGQLNISTAKLSWNGDLVAGAASGLYQRSTDTMPYGGVLTIDTKTYNSLQNVVFQTQGNNLAIGLNDKFPRKNHRPVDLVLSTNLINNSGIQKLSVKTLGNATVASDSKIAMPANSQFDLVASDIKVKGSIYSAGGSIRLGSGFDFNEAAGKQQFNPTAKLVLASTAELDVSGRWVNDFALGLNAIPTEPIAINAGAVSLTATGELTTRSGSAIKANAGAWLGLDQHLTEGKAGSISLAAVNPDNPALLRVNGKSSAYGLSEGGTLSLSSGKIIIGSADNQDQTNNPLILGVKDGHLKLPSVESFSKINLTSNFDDLVVKGQSSLTLIQKNRVLQENFRQQASSKSIFAISDVETLPAQLRNPVDLTLSARGDVKLETGSSIIADTQATVDLTTSQGSIFVDGVIDTPAGAINLTINPDSSTPYNPAEAIWLGQNAQLLAMGTTVHNPIDALGRRTGEVLDGGNITLDANRGYVVLQNGSKIDVSGTKATLDLQSADTNKIHYQPTQVGSNAGTISLIAAEGIVLDGEVKGHAGSATNNDGRIDIRLDRTARNPAQEIINQFSFDTLTLNVRQDRQAVLADKIQFGADLDALGLNGIATISSDVISSGGFDDVRLASINVNNDGTNSENSTVNFLGNVNLSADARIDIDSPNIQWSGLGDANKGTVNLNTAFFRAGSSLVRQTTQAPELGGGQFNVDAQWIEFDGASRWNKFNTLNFNSAHDIRTIGVLAIDSATDNKQQSDYVGELVAAADINLSASQIYPTTLTKFTFANENNPIGEINIKPSGNTDTSPLSAAGTLSFEAPIINQNGILKAPFGTISLTATTGLTLGESSYTSVSGAGQLIPFGIAFSGLDWLYPIAANNNLVFATPPEKKLVLSAPEIVLKKGSTVDISGGGDLLAYEFQSGPGGSNDYLATDSKSYNGGFAIVPSLGSSIAPYDHLQKDNYGAIGSQIYLSGTDSLPAGFYTILPPRYALLPGAYLVTPQANTQDLRAATHNIAGLPIIPGYKTLAGTGTKDSRWSGFLIENGTDIRKHSQYNEQTANNFYTQRALKNGTSTPILPVDSGQVIIKNAQTKLSLEGSFKVSSPGGRGARLDIAANRLKIVKALSAVPTVGTLEVLADDLTGLHVDSLLLGGERSNNISTGATDLNITSEEVIFDKGANVQVTDIIAAATQKVSVNSGATLTATGTVNTGDKQLAVDGNGALLRVSADQQVVLNRTALAGVSTNGQLVIEEGATLKSSKSMLLDATQSTTLAGDIEMQGGSLNLSANAINIGEVSGIATGALNLSNAKLQSLSVDELILNSRDTVNFYGNVGQQDQTGSWNPLTFNRLVMNSGGFSGFGTSSQVVRLQANTLQLQNGLNVEANTHGTGQGQLSLSADSYSQGSGSFAINGFSSVNIDVAKGFSADSTGSINVDADLNLTSGYITAANGNTLTVDATNHTIQIEGNGSTATPAIVTYGGAIDIIADAIGFNARASLPSGKLSLNSLTGDILVGSQAELDLAGRKVPFADIYDYTPGGTFSAIADKGKITLAAGSKVDLSTGGGSAAGGKLDLHAINQNVELLGQIKADAGSAVIDVADFNAGTTGFDGLMNVLNSSGISNSLYVRARQANIDQNSGNEINANKITLVADKGAISLAGKLNADTVTEGGEIKLFAADKITLENGAVISARGIGDTAKGGKVILSSTDVDGDLQSGIEIKGGSLIDVSGGANGVGGKVALQALRTDTNNDGIDDNIAIQPIAGTVQGYSQFYAEGIKKYSNQDLGNDGEINNIDIVNIKKDTDAYMTSATIQHINSTLGNGIQLRAGIEIDYKGDLTLKDKWDFIDWRYAESADKTALPGILNINVSGNFNIEKSLTDGFISRVDGFLENGSFKTETKDILQKNDSWSYQLTAGADLTSADKAAVGNGQNNLTLFTDPSVDPNNVNDHNTVVRTGTGDIELSASGDVIFQDKTSVYVAGKASEGSRQGSFSDAIQFNLYGDYPLAGGDLVINAQHNIQGSVTQDPFINKWMNRIGNWIQNIPDSRTPTAWAVDFVRFTQSVGSFGGGKVAINSGQSINDLAVIMPTTGKQIGQRITDSNFASNIVQVEGGGQLAVTAGKNIAGGVYYVGQGEGSLSAGENILGSSSASVVGSKTLADLTNGPQLLMGDTQLSLTANKDVGISAVSDPMILDKGDVNFFSYSAKSSISLKSLSGDVHLGADTSVITSTFQASSGQLGLSTLYPATLNTTAFGGNVLIDGTNTNIFLFPSATGELNLLASDNIAETIAGTKQLGMSDFDPKLLPNEVNTLSQTQLTDDSFNNITARLNPFTQDSTVHAQKPVHSGDDTPVRIVTQQGDIKNIRLNLAKKAIISSGRDINSVAIDIQHANKKGDVSVISAARDILNPSQRDIDFGTLVSNKNKINIAGTGNVLIKSGRNIDLGASDGLSTVGNTYNQNLPNSGANVTVLVGLNGAEPNYLGLLNLNADVLKYAENYNKFQGLVTEFMRNRTGNTALTAKTATEEFKQLQPSDYASLQPELDALVSNKYTYLLGQIKNEIVTFVKQYENNPTLTETQALNIFAGLNPNESLPIQPRLNVLADKILFTELNQTGTASAADATLGNERGFAAINALYPGNAWKGDLNLFFSKLQTLNDGSINLLVPGGEINAGLAVVSNDLQKSSSDLGIVAQGKGDINAFVKNDFIVNQSRVFALGGGDILIWSSEGNIDAGRGAKSALAAPPPVISFDQNGNLVITFPAVVSGSGIRTAAPIGKKAGNVSLFAPGGVVNAGEAGIAGNNVTISATAVLGANNIQVGGISSGVPAASTGSLAAGLTGVSNLTANVSQVAQASADFSKDAETSNNKSVKLGTITVELLGFGE